MKVPPFDHILIRIAHFSAYAGKERNWAFDIK